MTTLEALQNHITTMAPHQKDRAAGKLLIEASAVILELQTRLIRRTEEATATAYRDAETIRGLKAALDHARNRLINGVSRLCVMEEMDKAMTKWGEAQ